MPRAHGLTDKEMLFCQEYLVNPNRPAAYLRASYKPGKTPAATSSLASRRYAKPSIQQEVQRLVAERAERIHVKAEHVLRRLTDIAFADITKITACHIGACRYCWGIEHRYQWRTPREFSEAVEQHMLKGEAYQANHPAPDNEGGYGYLAKRDPNPECPECEGDGIQRVRFKDTRDMTAAERAVFAGVEQTQHGIKYRLNDQVEALVTIAKHLQML